MEMDRARPDIVFIGIAIMDSIINREQVVEFMRLQKDLQ